MTLEERIEGCFLGLAVGDALGVPVEFTDRKLLQLKPVFDMRGFGTWNQPAGTWSDDSSLTFCLAESLSNGYDLEDIGRSFLKWKNEGYWGARHKVFDIGNATRAAIDRLIQGEHPIYSGSPEEDSNGNGSLMRIAPASIYFYGSHDEDLFDRITEISGITHRHIISVFSCFIFSKVVQKIIEGEDKITSYKKAIKEINDFKEAPRVFNRVLDGSLPNLKEETIGTSGYVLHTLEAGLWCFLNTTTYETAVLTAVNLGEDTDTTACVTGALAGLYYGPGEIRDHWKTTIARGEDIRVLASNFAASISRQ